MDSFAAATRRIVPGGGVMEEDAVDPSFFFIWVLPSKRFVLRLHSWLQNFRFYLYSDTKIFLYWNRMGGTRATKCGRLLPSSFRCTLSLSLLSSLSLFLHHFFFFFFLYTQTRTHTRPMEQPRHDILVMIRSSVCGKPKAFLLVVFGTNVNLVYYQTVLPPFVINSRMNHAFLVTQNDSWA